MKTLPVSTAWFSPCRTWRYALQRVWDVSLPVLIVIGLNPSTADETKNDATIRRCLAFARAWGYGSLVMLNLFAIRGRDPAVIGQVADPIGPYNVGEILNWTRPRRLQPLIVCAWGNDGAIMDQGARVARILRENGRVLHAIKINAGTGQPAHPLYLSSKLTPILYVA